SYYKAQYLYIDTVEVWGSSPHGPTIYFNYLRRWTNSSLTFPVAQSQIDRVLPSAGSPIIARPANSSDSHALHPGARWSKLAKVVGVRAARHGAGLADRTFFTWRVKDEREIF